MKYKERRKMRFENKNIYTKLKILWIYKKIDEKNELAFTRNYHAGSEKGSVGLLPKNYRKIKRKIYSHKSQHENYENIMRIIKQTIKKLIFNYFIFNIILNFLK